MYLFVYSYNNHGVFSNEIKDEGCTVLNTGYILDGGNLYAHLLVWRFVLK